MLQFGFTQRSEEPVSRRTVMSWPGVPISTGVCEYQELHGDEIRGSMRCDVLWVA